MLKEYTWKIREEGNSKKKYIGLDMKKLRMYFGKLSDEKKN